MFKFQVIFSFFMLTLLSYVHVSDVNGWLSDRQAEDLTWNRTVNIRGGAGHNVAMDKMNEFLNNEFKGIHKTLVY
jgi:hypothetical protein